MSTYYDYYIGYMHEGKIYPLGPFNCFGKLKPIYSASKSFISNLCDCFGIVPEASVSDELRKFFTRKDWNGNDVVNVKYLPFKELPSGDYIRKGYFLIEDVEEYEKSGETSDIFYDSMSPTVYAAKSKNELVYGKAEQEVDEEGEPIVNHSASDYMYYAYPDYISEEYESSIIKQTGYALAEYEHDIENDELVALLVVS